MTIGELARRTGLSAYTIRYYERIGLLPYAPRAGYRRDYDATILTWIAFLLRLKATGMPLREMLRYAALREKGIGTETERRLILERHRAAVKKQLAGLKACLLILDDKIAGYARTETRNKDHDAKSPKRKPSRTRQARSR